ncbi:hypothetical protein GF389_06070 [Candidatus Dojkabacteria bacterium]|nr:hypothetical protein [Candidatus Dojkabacteria bacterium]
MANLEKIQQAHKLKPEMGDNEATTKSTAEQGERSGNSQDVKEAQKIRENDLPPLDEQPIQGAMQEVKEEKSRKPRRKGARGLRFIKCNCQTCSCFGCLSVMLLIAVIALVAYFRPPFVLNPIKKYLNQGYQPQPYQTSSVVDINNQIAEELSDEGKATISEQQLQTLMNEQVGTEEVFVDVEPSSIRAVVDIEGESSVPLYLIIEFSHTSDDKLKITKLGFERVSAPKFVRDGLTESVFGLLEASATQGENEGAQFINSFVNQDNEDDIANVRFEKDQVVIFLKQ